jgi:predicted dehydrogenase
MTTPLRVGIVGSGFGGTVHAPAFSLHPGYTVVGIASPTNASKIAAERKIPNAFDSLAAMLDGVELDVVSVASPPFDHHPSVLAALARGKHVLCEKPMAMDVAEAEEMLAAAERAGVVTGIAHEFRFVPARIALKQLIENGHLGALRMIESTIMVSFLREESRRARGWWFEREKGGGPLGAFGSHLIDAATWLAGRPPIAVHGFARTANPERTDDAGSFTSTVDDGAFAFLDYGDGLVGRMSVDGTSIVASSLLGAHGENRTAVVSGESLVDPKLYTLDAEEQDELDVVVSPYAKYAVVHPNVPPFMALLDEFAKAIAGEPNGTPTFADGVATQRVLDAIRAS